MRKQIDLTMLSGLIPYGEENAISRQQLVIATQTGDRNVRDAISELRMNEVILHSLKGGYYKPMLNDTEKVRKYIATEEHRFKSTAKAIKYARRYLADMERGVICGN